MTKLLMILFAYCLAANAQDPGPLLKAQFDQVQQSLLKKYGLTSEQVYFSLYDIEDKRPLELSQAETKITLASVSKILTTLYALGSMNEGERPLTRLDFKGERGKDGQWQGDLILRGGGDPMLDIPEFMDAVLALKRQGLKSFKGNLYFDDSLFPALAALSRVGWEDQTYNPGISALSSHFNRFHIYGPDNTPLPAVAGLKVSKSEDKLPAGLLALADSGLSWTLSSQWSLGRNKERDLPVRNPSLFSAELFRYVAQMAGLTLPAPAPIPNPIAANEVWRHRGLTFMRLIELTLEYSNNLLAETLLLHAAVKNKANPLDLKSAATHMQEWLLKKYQPSDATAKNAIELEGGSGITSGNKIAPYLLTDILAAEWEDPSINPSLISLLSIGGHSGWISERFKAPESRYRVWAKTGSLDFVSNMAGYLFTRGEKARHLAFALFIVDGPKRLILDQGSTEAGFKISQGAADFRNRASAFSEEWIEHWLTKY